MKTVVNLYVTSLKPEHRRFTLARTVLGLALLVGGLVCTGGALQVMLARAETSLGQLQAELASQQAQVQQLSTTLTERRGDPALATRLAKTQAAIASAEQTLTLLQQQSDPRALSYARLLTDIAALAPGDLWLTQIQAHDAQLGFMGLTQNAAALPRWLATFDSRPSLKGQQFEIFALRENEQGLLEFELQSERSAATMSTGSKGVRP